ncbi:hypothetical protein ACF09C_28185 [Streptomyces sp. NPDC014870]|uniref:hypothetical protein n=1 Tax=Streptomyces sp. NPDC014870 TaxID=3364925 RepID=UPI0036FF5AF1
MDHENGWGPGPVGEGDVGRDALVGVVRRSAAGLPGGRVVVAAVVCELCGSGEFASDEFEVWGGECHCIGCLLPIGVRDGDVLPRAFGMADGRPWTLPPVDASPEPEGYLNCPQGHGVFHVAVALVLDEAAAVRAVSVGLRCPEDGALHLFLDRRPVGS